MDKIKRRPQPKPKSAWRVFIKALIFTALCLIMLMIGFFGAGLITGQF